LFSITFISTRPSYDEMSFYWRSDEDDNLFDVQEGPRPTRLQQARRRMATFLFRNRGNTGQ
jgi:hypothetical protein